MNHSDYLNCPGLSYSGMKDLAISPLRYYHLHVDPNRIKPAPTPAMIVGSAMHTAILEPLEFEKRYAPELNPDESALGTVDEIRAFITSKGGTPGGTRKADLAAQALVIDPKVVVIDIAKAEHAKLHAGKTILTIEQWNQVSGMCQAFFETPACVDMMHSGKVEQSLFATDPETGVPLKCRIDYLAPHCTPDIKSFSQTRGKSIDRTVADAIWYEKYHWQAYFYAKVRSLQPQENGQVVDPRIGAQRQPPHVLVFIESEEPHEVRIRSLSSRTEGEVSLYWEHARIETRRLVDLYAEYWSTFGPDKPWRTSQEARPLLDSELPGVLYS